MSFFLGMGTQLREQLTELSIDVWAAREQLEDSQLRLEVLRLEVYEVYIYEYHE